MSKGSMTHSTSATKDGHHSVLVIGGGQAAGCTQATSADSVAA